MDYTILDDLMTLPKKTDASKEKKNAFVEQMGRLLEEEGLSDKSIYYLRNGFGFAETKPIASYLISLDEEKREKEIERLIASDLLHGKDNSSSFRFGISLLARIPEGIDCNHKLLVELIKILPLKSRNKDGQLLKEASKAFEKYYLDIMKSPVVIPDMQDYGINVGVINHFRKSILVILEGVSPKYTEKKKLVIEWASDPQDKPDDETLAGNDANNSDSRNVNTQKENAAFGINDVEAVERFTKRILATINNLDQFKKEKNDLQRQIDESQKEIIQLKNLVERNKKECEKLEEAKEYLRQQVIVLQSEREALHKKVESQEQTISTQMEANRKLNSVVSVYSEDKQSSQVELLNSIASKLRSEYRDFKEAENDEMTIDLGENFRLQLDAVFKILTKAGIEIEKR